MTNTKAVHSSLTRIMGCSVIASVDAVGTLTFRGRNASDSHTAKTIVESLGFPTERVPGSRNYSVQNKDQS